MTEAVETLINGRWPLWLPEHRHHRPEWPWWEATRLAAMHHFLKPGDLVLDVGAEEGDFPALWATWGCDVFLVEPNPRVWPNIKFVWEHNNLLPPAGWFVGFCADTESKPIRPDNDGDIFCVGPDDVVDWPSCAFGDVIGDHGHRHLAEELDTTPATTIDLIAKRLPRKIDVITMDIEGAELRALNGAENTLRNDRPLVFVSVHDQFMRDMYGERSDALYFAMGQLDYERVFLALDHESHELFVPAERMWPR